MTTTYHLSLGLPTSINRSTSRPGCGCCAHCQCTGHCVEVEYSPELLVPTISPNRRSPQRSPQPSRSPTPMPPPSRVPSPMPPPPSTSTYSNPRKAAADFLSVMESVPHPNDVITMGRKSSKNNPTDQPMTPSLPSRREAHSRSNSNSKEKRDREGNATLQRQRDGNTSAAASRPASPEPMYIDRNKDTAQEDYEKGYSSSHFHRDQRRNVEATVPEIEIRTWAPSNDGEAEGNARGVRQRDRNGSRKDITTGSRRERVNREDVEESNGKEMQRRGSDAARKESTYKEDVKEEQNRSKSQSPREQASPPIDNLATTNRPHYLPETVSFTMGPITLTRTKSRNEAATTTTTEGPTPAFQRIASKRDLIKELIKSSTPIPVNMPLSSTTPLYNTNLEAPPRGIEVQAGEDGRFGSFNASKKFTVHCAQEWGLMIHFLDWSRRNESNEPLVAFRLEDGENGPFEKKSGGLFKKQQGSIDWVKDSHENGIKVKGRLNLGVGVRGPILFHIDVKRRKVDKFTISGTKENASGFKDDPHYGKHDDYRHIYFETPDGRPMKWYLAEPRRVMRLYGRGEKDYGKLYAEAKIGRSEGKKNKGAKETQILFFDPNHPDQPSLKSAGIDSTTATIPTKDSGNIDYGFLCASWWCARQTFDESRIVEAHAEVEFIENIEKAFEVDLLAGA